jgi:hypothetical protein
MSLMKIYALDSCTGYNAIYRHYRKLFELNHFLSWSTVTWLVHYNTVMNVLSKMWIFSSRVTALSKSTPWSYFFIIATHMNCMYANKKKLRTQQGFKPGTSYTQSMNHTPKPLSRWLLTFYVLLESEWQVGTWLLRASGQHFQSSSLSVRVIN